MDLQHREFSAQDRERFSRYLCHDLATGCITWTGGVDKCGYGLFRVSRPRGMVKSHRVAYVLAGRILSAGVHVLHRCDNPRCCNPEHLMPGSHDDNHKDKARKGRGRRSVSGLPLGVRILPSGKFNARVRRGGGMRGVGTFDTWQEAAALAAFHKNANLFPDLSVN